MTAAPQLLPEQARLGAQVAAAGEEDSHSCQSASSAKGPVHDLLPGASTGWYSFGDRR